jgi:DNA-binding CsgD family transcriptional regulator
MAPLMPHIRWAAGLRVKLDELTQRAQLHQDIFDRLNFPVVVAAANGHIVMANARGAAWLSQPGNPISAGARQAGPVAAILKAACAQGPTRRAAGTKLRKPSGVEYYLTAVPLPTDRVGWTEHGPLALLLVTDPEQARPHSAGLLRQVFQLTPAEIRLLALLQQGLSIKETSSELEVSLHTVRTQLKSMFAKLGIRRQADLFRVIGQINLVNDANDEAGG